MSEFIDAVCPSCGAKLRAQVVDPPPGGPNVFAPYPHRARAWKGWCHKGTWTATEFVQSRSLFSEPA